MNLFQRVRWYWRIKAINRALTKPAPERIAMGPRSRMMSRDYYLARFYDEDGVRFWIDAIDGDEFVVRDFDNEPLTVAKQDTHDLGLAIDRFWQDHEYTEVRPALFLLKDRIGWYRLLNQWDRVAQSFYNRRKLARRERIELLESLLDKHLRSTVFTFSVTSLMWDTLGSRFGRHPRVEESFRYYELLLSSLEHDGDIVREQQVYRVTPQAMHTLERFHRNRKRERHNLFVQWTLAALTAALVALTAYNIIEAEVSSQASESISQ